MNASDERLFRIPIRETTVDSLCISDLKDIEFHELVGLALIATIDNDPKCVNSENAELRYAVLLNAIIEWPRSDKEKLFNTIIKKMSPEQCKIHLNNAGIVLMSLAEFEARNYRTPTGEWVSQDQRLPKFDVKLKRFIKSEDEVLRQVNTAMLRIKQCPDEHFKIDGVAGSGKTTLTARIVHSLPQNDLILLTRKPEQFAGTDIERFCCSPVEACLEFVQSIMVDSFDIRFGNKVPLHRMADHFSIPERHGWDSATVMSYILETVDNFCRSGDMEFGHSHLPGAIPDEWLATSKYFIEKAAVVWRELASPRHDSKLPLTDLHVIKLAQINDFVLPKKHVVADEQHDLTPAMSCILQKNSNHHTCIVLGDEHQITDAHPRLGMISPYPVDTYTIDQSIRSGVGADTLVKAAMSTSAEGRKCDIRFFGNDSRRTEVIPYGYSLGGEIFVPNEDALMISGSAWWLLVASIKLIQMRKPFKILPRTSVELYSVLCLNRPGFRGGSNL